MATATETQKLTARQKELVAVGASIGAGCHPCVSHHLKASADAGLGGEQLLAAVTTAEHITAEAAILMADHARDKLGPDVSALAELSALEDALAALGAALGANDASAIDLQMRTAHEFGASRAQLEQAIETAKTVQEHASRIHIRDAQRLLDSITSPAATAETAAVASSDCGCKSNDETETATKAHESTGETAGVPEDASHSAMSSRCREMFERMFGPPNAAAEAKQPEAAIRQRGCSDIREV